MPFINLKTNVKVDEKKELTIKEQLGKAIEVLPGKSEAWLMLNFEDECRLYFKGNNNPAAFFEVKVYGNVSQNTSNELTEKLCDIAQRELSVDKSRVYVKYEETEYWGWNGGNF